MKQKFKYLINALIRRGYWFNHMFFEGCRRLITYDQFNTEVVNLGSTSAVHAFNYDGLKVKGGNWAMTRNPLLGDYAILRNYSGFLKEEGSIVLIPLCPFTALSGSYDYLDDRYYTVLYPSTIPNYSYVHDVQVQAKWTSPLYHYPILALFKDFGNLLFPGRNKKLRDVEMQLDADKIMLSWMHEFSIEDFSYPLSLKNYDAIEDAANYINNIISYCKYKKCKPVLVIPPVYKTLAEKFTPEIKSLLFDQLLDRIEDKNVCLYSYLNNEVFIYNASLFENSFLMNRTGAKLFTITLLKDIGLL